MTQKYLGQITDTSQVSGDDLALMLNQFDLAHKTNQAGPSRPNDIEPGGIWSREVSPGVFALMLFDGAMDRVIGSAQLAGQADRIAYYNGNQSLALATLTSFGRSLLDDADAATARATLGLTYSTQAEALVGTANNKTLTPERGRDVVMGMMASSAEALAGTATDRVMSPSATMDAVRSKSIGEGQTWVDVTASRSYNTSYYNNTGRTITVCIMGPETGGAGWFQVSTNNVTWVNLGRIGSEGAGDSKGRNTASWPVGNKLYYRVSGGSKELWAEYR